MDKYIYMDFGATTYIKKDVLEEMNPYLHTFFGNPSSLYSLGRKSKAAIDKSREIIGNQIGASSGEIYFTSGGTESNNFALRGIAYGNKNKGNKIIISSIEHPGVINTCKQLEREGFEISTIPVDSMGLINMDKLKKEIDSSTILVSIMFANNEIGTIEPILEIGELCKEKNVIFHCDAVQAFQFIPIDVDSLNIDLLTISGHKIYAPKGIGALYVRKGIKVDPLIYGGEQERGKRAGTENVSSIVGFGKAVTLVNLNMEKTINNITFLRDRLIKGLLQIEGTSLNGDPINRLPNNLNISFEGVSGETLLMMLDNENIYVSSGSACSSLSLEPSNVLLNIGLSKDKAKSSIRFTLGDTNTLEEIDYVIIKVRELVYKIREINKNWK